MSTQVRTRKATVAWVAVAVMACIAAFGTVARARVGGNQKSAAKPVETTKLTIEVTGGADQKPIAEASVYVKFVEVVKHGRDQNLELNLKTNQDGVTHSPDIPQGKVLIQIVAPGWKTFGQYYTTDAGEQTIQIHLERPATKWY
jgi:hypothetical protein